MSKMSKPHEILDSGPLGEYLEQTGSGRSSDHESSEDDAVREGSTDRSCLKKGLGEWR